MQLLLNLRYRILRARFDAAIAGHLCFATGHSAAMSGSCSSKVQADGTHRVCSVCHVEICNARSRSPQKSPIVSARCGMYLFLECNEAGRRVVRAALRSQVLGRKRYWVRRQGACIAQLPVCYVLDQAPPYAQSVRWRGPRCAWHSVVPHVSSSWVVNR